MNEHFVSVHDINMRNFKERKKEFHLKNLMNYQQYRESVQKATEDLIELIKEADEARMHMVSQAHFLSTLSKECYEASAHVPQSPTEYKDEVKRNEATQATVDSVVGNHSQLAILNLQSNLT